MTAAVEDPTVQRRKLRIALRRQREAADLTQRQAADGLDWSLSKLIRIEAGAQGVSVTDLKAMLALYGVTERDIVAGLVTAARGSRGQSWWHGYRDIVSPQFAQYLGHEGIASSFRIFSSLLVPGLLQTEEYAAALHGAFPDPDRARRIVEFRMERQERLFSNPGLGFEFILDEEALYRWIGGPAVMRRQLEHLVEVAESSKASLRIVPFIAGAHPGLGGGFIMLYSGDARENTVFVESVTGDELIRDDPKSIALYRSYFAQLSQLSLAPKQGNDLLRELIDRLPHVGEGATGHSRENR
jgi:transcriptional regulator with XRE-family HTH domain